MWWLPFTRQEEAERRYPRSADCVEKPRPFVAVCSNSFLCVKRAFHPTRHSNNFPRTGITFRRVQVLEDPTGVPGLPRRLGDSRGPRLPGISYAPYLPKAPRSPRIALLPWLPSAQRRPYMPRLPQAPNLPRIPHLVRGCSVVRICRLGRKFRIARIVAKSATVVRTASAAGAASFARPEVQAAPAEHHATEMLKFRRAACLLNAGMTFTAIYRGFGARRGYL